jgi:HEPN domain-containing protein
MGKNTPTDSIGFHCQQCIEKYWKGFLVFLGIPFPKTHDLAKLVKLFPKGQQPKLSVADQERFTYFATTLRYPGGGPEISLAEARKAVATARRIRREVRRLLPRAVLRRRK